MLVAVQSWRLEVLIVAVLLGTAGCRDDAEPPPPPPLTGTHTPTLDSDTDPADSVSRDSAGTADSAPPDPPGPRNVLVLLLDDVGIDKLGSYAAQLADAGHEPTLRPATPVMDSLAAAGVRFSQAWASPTCSPTRASLHTGQHPFRHGVTAPVPPAPELESDDLTLPELVAETHATALIGKWHLGISGVDGDLDRLPVWDDLAAQGTAAEPVLQSHTLNPTLHGWGVFTGSLGAGLCTSGGDQDCNAAYDDWTAVAADADERRVVDQREQHVARVWRDDTYATEADVIRTLDWVSRVGDQGPWMAWVAFRASHTPLHDATDYGCSTTDVSDQDPEDAGVRFLTMTECLDTWIGTLLDGLQEAGELQDTLVVLVSDNGTTFSVGEGTFGDSERGKGTAYESGVRVPLVLAEGAIWHADRSGQARPAPVVVAEPGRVASRPVLVLDLFATLGEVVGADTATGVDAVSFGDLLADPTAPDPERVLFTENSRTEGGHAVGVAALQDAQGYKLLVDVSVDPGDDSRVCARHALYDMGSDPLESRELSGVAECAEALAALQSAVADLALEGATWLAAEACSDP